MKLACASDTCAHLLEAGELTQIEFLDRCAGEFACESVVLNVRHFPRTDLDYLAQIKKMAVDRGLAIAAATDDAFLTRERPEMESHIELAAALGAPLLVTKAARETDMSWSEQLERLNHATGLAKRANVTLALRNAAGTFAASALDCKRVTKEADSAWLRFAFDPAAIEATDDTGPLEEKSVGICADLDADDAAIAAFAERFAVFRGPIILSARRAMDTAETKSALHRWRTALARSYSTARNVSMRGN